MYWLSAGFGYFVSDFNYQKNLKDQNVTIEKMPLLYFHKTDLSVSDKN